MKKIITTAVLVSIVTLTLSGCAPGENTPGATAVGAATGGLIASTIFHGDNTFAGVIAGSLIGGSVGYMVGRSMDKQDQINMQNAIVDTPIGEEASWTNPRTEVTYEVRPTRHYRRGGRYCRDYETRIRINGRWRTAYGKACRMPEGGWRIVS